MFKWENIFHEKEVKVSALFSQEKALLTGDFHFFAYFHHIHFGG